MKLWGGKNRRKPSPQKTESEKEPFEIDWEQVWKREELERKARLTGRPAPQDQKPGKKTKKKRFWKRSLVALTFLAGLYCVAVFAPIPFIAKWRAIYIETAMGTMTHQWLATAFIPSFVIDDVMGKREQVEQEQQGLESQWKEEGFGESQATPWDKLRKDFFQQYPQIEEASFEEYMKEHGEEAIDEEGYLLIDKAGLEDEDTGIRTKKGDQVLAVDTRSGIIICKVTGEGYVGRLALVRDPSQVGVALAPSYGSVGSLAADIAE